MKEISIVIPFKYSVDQFERTLSRLAAEVSDSDEIIIVDGSGCDAVPTLVKKHCAHLHNIQTIFDEGRGVFYAQNLGIKAAKYEWVIVINPGDFLIPDSRNYIDKAICHAPNIDIHVFSQYLVDDDGELMLKFTPNAKSLWPHQAMLVNRRVYSKHGLYDTRLRYGAEQMYFAQHRDDMSFEIHDHVISAYLDGGLSTGVSFSHSQEKYKVLRALHLPIISALCKAYCYPLARQFLTRLFGVKRVRKFIALIMPHYRLTETKRN